jgi:hypothetical protein
MKVRTPEVKFQFHKQILKAYIGLVGNLSSGIYIPRGEGEPCVADVVCSKAGQSETMRAAKEKVREIISRKRVQNTLEN